jgi:hypothetical protein
MPLLATQIRDAMFDRITAAVPFKTARKVPIPPLQPDQLPALGVYLMSQRSTPDGDANVGVPRYIDNALISVMLIYAAGDPRVLEGVVDAQIDLIERLLLCDSTFLQMLDVETGEPIIESVPERVRTYQYPKDGETYYLEARLQMTFQFRSYFQPLAPNMLQQIMVTSQAFGDDAFHTEIDVGT